MTSEAIRVRIVPHEAPSRLQDPSNPREAFWAAVRSDSRLDNTIAQSEAKLRRNFGVQLRRTLLRELAEPFRILDSEIFPDSIRDLASWMSGFENRISPEREYSYQFAEAISRVTEQRQQMLRESPSLRRAQERLTAAAAVSFSTRIAGYSSLNLEISVSSFNQLARAFENEFDSFRVFLEAFVPVAFAGVFTEDSADKLDFSVNIPPSAERAFRAADADIRDMPLAAPAAAPTVISQQGATRERAEWLWRLANGSLLVPVLLTVLVAYEGMKSMNDIRATQYEALKPVLEHQLKLLEEDRLRLSREAAQGSAASPATPAPLEPAEASRVNQGSVPRSETREEPDDCNLDSLRRHVVALGGELEVVAVFGDKKIAVSGAAPQKPVLPPN